MKIKIWAILLLSYGLFTAAQAFTAKELAQRSFERRAVEAAIWGMPLVNFAAMRQAYFHDAQAQYNDVLYFSKPANWKFQTTTPNNSTNYVLFFVNVKNGPVVIELPPVEEAALFGSITDSWNIPLVDVGNAGQDKGKGGKYLLLPPDYKAEIPAGYIPVYSSTYNLYSLMRLIPKTQRPEDLTKAITYLQKLKIHPLAKDTLPHFIDMADKSFAGITAYDVRFYTLLAQMVAEEPVDEHDVAIMGQLITLGIGKNRMFNPDAAAQKMLEHSLQEAHEFMIAGFKATGALWWPERKWRFPANKEVMQSKLTFVHDERLLLDERAYTFFAAYAAPLNPSANLYLKVFEDKDGDALTGSQVYKLHLPANVPSTQFWSLVAYDVETAGFIRQATVVGIDSYNQHLKKNSDGSIDIFLAATPPKGHETNWISTSLGQPFFLFFRNYAPEQSVLERTSLWVLGDVEKIK